MKNEKSKNRALKVLVVTAILMAMAVQSVLAASKPFTKAHVDSNTFNAVYGTTTTKENSAVFPEIWLENIYKANGDDSNYKKVRFSVYSGSNQASIDSSTTVEKGTMEYLKLTTNYKKVGTSLTLYAMGNDPALDCQITGTFAPH